MKPISKYRIMLSIIFPIKIDTYPKKKSFLIRKRILHKGYQILEEVIDLSDNNERVRYDFICNLKNWDAVSLFKQKRLKDYNERL